MVIFSNCLYGTLKNILDFKTRGKEVMHKDISKNKVSEFPSLQLYPDVLSYGEKVKRCRFKKYKQNDVQMAIEIFYVMRRET